MGWIEGRRAHSPGDELGDPIDRVSLGDLGQDVADVGLWVQATEFCRVDEGVYVCGALASGIGTGEEVVFPTQNRHTHGVFGDVVVRLKPAVSDEEAECGAPLDRIS